MKRKDIDKALDRLPILIFDKAYSINFSGDNNKLYTPIIQMNYDIDVEKSFNAETEQEYDFELSRDFKYYHIEGWEVIMETNKGEYCPSCGKKVNEADGSWDLFHDNLEIGKSEYDG